MAVTMNDVAGRPVFRSRPSPTCLNDYEFIRPATKQRVEDAIAELGYEANLTARSLRSGKTSMLGLVLSDLSAPYYAELASRLMDAASRRGYRVLVEQSGADRRAELQRPAGPVPATHGRPAVHAAVHRTRTTSPQRAGTKPLVMLGEHVVDPRFDLVTMKNEEAAAALTRHLLAGGRRRIAVIGATPEEIRRRRGLRLNGYRTPLQRLGSPSTRR